MLVKYNSKRPIKFIHFETSDFSEEEQLYCTIKLFQIEIAPLFKLSCVSRFGQLTLLYEVSEGSNSHTSHISLDNISQVKEVILARLKQENLEDLVINQIKEWLGEL